jgi:hypothetical protein
VSRAKPTFDFNFQLLSNKISIFVCDLHVVKIRFLERILMIIPTLPFPILSAKIVTDLLQIPKTVINLLCVRKHNITGYTYYAFFTKVIQYYMLFSHKVIDFGTICYRSVTILADNALLADRVIVFIVG